MTRTMTGLSMGLMMAATSAWTAANGQLAEPFPDPQRIYLRQVTVDAAAPLVSDEGEAEAAAASDYYVLQLDGPMTPDRRLALEQAGVRLGDYLPVNAFIARLGATELQTLQQSPFVRWIGRYQRDWKLDPQIGQRPLQHPDRLRLRAEGRLALTVTLFESEDLQAAVGQLAGLGATLVGANLVGGQGVIEIYLPAERLPTLADLAAVQFVEEAGEAVLRNDLTTWVIQSNVPNVTSVWDQGIHGEGQTGGLIDSSLGAAHCVFRDPQGNPFGPLHRKIQAYYGTQGASTHGTHTGGTFVGDQWPINGTTYRNGLAYGARLVFTNLSMVTSTNLYDRLNVAHADGARAHSNSWGDDGTTAYTNWCRQIDQYSWDHEDGLVLFAVTNTSTLKTPENAKNVLAVGASQQAGNQHTFCSGGRGPTSDGRRKPEIFSPGCSINSASAGTDCSWRSSTGTSMACPSVAGAALLVRQYFADGYYPTGSPGGDGLSVSGPSGALVKAVLLNAAVDMTGIAGYPSAQEGWGRLLLDDGLYFAWDARKLFVADVPRPEGLSTGAAADYELTVQSASVPLKVTLVWHDYPAAVNAGYTPVNNLDLMVTAPGGVTYLGNQFSNGQSAPGGSPDPLNNVEQVHLSAPVTGSYSIRVQGTAVNQATQGYALVATGDLVVGGSLPGDFDGDGDVDLSDFSIFQQCYGGSGNPPAPTCPPGVDADLDNDGDVDLADFLIFQQHFTGSR